MVSASAGRGRNSPRRSGRRHRIVAGFVTLGVPHERTVASRSAGEADIADAASGRINCASALIAFQVMRRMSADDLARLRRLAEAGERRVVAQKELVEQLEASGDKASTAEEIILRSMRDGLNQLRRQRRDAGERT